MFYITFWYLKIQSKQSWWNHLCDDLWLLYILMYASIKHNILWYTIWPKEWVFLTITHIYVNQTVAIKSEAHDGLICLCIIQHLDFPSLELKGPHLLLHNSVTVYKMRFMWSHGLPRWVWKNSRQSPRPSRWTSVHDLSNALVTEWA